jgi:7-cyano-7-deazaguanine synthase in queuosine biosynthesis
MTTTKDDFSMKILAKELTPPKSILPFLPYASHPSYIKEFERVDNYYVPGLYLPYDEACVKDDFISNSHIVTISGGGIDSFITNLVAMAVEVQLVYYSVSTLPRKLNKSYMINFDYGQENAEAEKIMNERQAKFISEYGTPTQAISLKTTLYTDVVNERAKEYIDVSIESACKQPVSKSINPVKELGTTGLSYAPYIPMRNPKFIIDALAAFQVIEGGKKDVIIAIGAVGQGHLDNSPMVIQNIVNLLQDLNPDINIAIYAPFAGLVKSRVVKVANDLLNYMYSTNSSVLPTLTTSCFVNDFPVLSDVTKESPESPEEDTTSVVQCGNCKSCKSLKEAYRFAGISDPFKYEK